MFLPLIHGLCALLRPLLTPVSTALPPSLPASQFIVCTSWFTHPRSHFHRDTFARYALLLAESSIYTRHQVVSGYGSHLCHNASAEVLGSGVVGTPPRVVLDFLSRFSPSFLRDAEMTIKMIFERSSQKGGRQRVRKEG